MAKLEKYNGSVDLISGLRQKNGGTFPLMDANAIQTREDGTRLDAELDEIKQRIENAGGGGGDIQNIKLIYGGNANG